jgi:hypothetical protein
MERPEVVNRHGLQLELLHRHKPSRALSLFTLVTYYLCAN